MAQYSYTIRFMAPGAGAAGLGMGGVVFNEPTIGVGNTAFLDWGRLVNFQFTLTVARVAYAFQPLNAGQKSGGFSFTAPATLIGIYTPAMAQQDATLAVAHGAALRLFYTAATPQQPATSRWTLTPPHAAAVGGTLQVIGPTRLM